MIYLDNAATTRPCAEAVAAVIRAEALSDRVVLNQAETNPDAARQLAALLPYPVLLTTLNKGELLCSY